LFKPLLYRDHRAAARRVVLASATSGIVAARAAQLLVQYFYYTTAIRYIFKVHAYLDGSGLLNCHPFIY
jgi:hypothetical protein